MSDKGGCTAGRFASLQKQCTLFSLVSLREVPVTYCSWGQKSVKKIQQQKKSDIITSQHAD